MYVSRGKAVMEALGQYKFESEYFIALNPAVIEQVKSHKLLGIHLDQDLDFDIQTEALGRSLSKKIGFHISPYLKRSHKVLYYVCMTLSLNLLSSMVRVTVVIYEQGKLGEHSQTSKEGSKSDPECTF